MTSDFDSKTQGTLKESIVCHLSDLFRGLGHVPGEISIKLKRDAEPVSEPCRKVPVGKFKALEEELNRMEENDVITKIEEPTDWVNSLHLVYKQDRSLRVCLDPRNVYKAIRREHFKLPTREEIMAKMSGGKYFSKIDCTRGFWQLKLDEDSSKLCTFNTSFGGYRYLCLEFRVLQRYTTEPSIRCLKQFRTLIHRWTSSSYGVRLENSMMLQ